MSARADAGKGRARSAARISRRGRTAQVVLITLFLIVTPAILYFTILLNTHEESVVNAAFHDLDRASRQLDFVFRSADEMTRFGGVVDPLPYPFRPSPQSGSPPSGGQADADEDTRAGARHACGAVHDVQEESADTNTGGARFELIGQGTVQVHFDSGYAVEFGLADALAGRQPDSFEQLLIATKGGEVLATVSDGRNQAAGYPTWPRIGGVVSVENLLDDAGAEARQRGAAGNAASIADLAGTSRPSGRDTATGEGAPQVPVSFERTLAGERYRIFVRPHRIEETLSVSRRSAVQAGGTCRSDAGTGPAGDGDDTAGCIRTLYLIGLEHSGDAVSAAGALGPSAITASGLVFLFLLLAWPLVRLLFLETHDALRPGQVVVTQAAAVGLMIALVAAGARWMADRNAYHALDEQARQTADEIAERFRRDLLLDAAALATRRAQHSREATDSAVRVANARFTALEVEALSRGEPGLLRNSRPAEFIFAADENGKLTLGCAPTEGLAPLAHGSEDEWRDATAEVAAITIDDRTYFQRIVNERGWPLSTLSDGFLEGSFYFERIVNRLTGRRIGELAIPAICSTPECPEAMWGADLPFHDYASAVLPGQLEFALFDDRTGMIVFHSQDTRSLVENVYADIDDPGLRTLVAQRAASGSAALSLVHEGGNIRASYRPIRGVPLSVLVYYDRDAVAHWSGTAMAIAIGVVFVLFAALIVAGLLIAAVAQRWASARADERGASATSAWRKTRFGFLVVPAAGMALGLLVFVLNWQDPEWWAICALVAGLATVALAVLARISAGRLAEPGARRGLFMHLSVGVAVLSTAFVIDATLRNNLELQTRFHAEKTLDRIAARLALHDEEGDWRGIDEILARYSFGLDECDSADRRRSEACYLMDRSAGVPEAGSKEPRWLGALETGLKALPFGIGGRAEYAHAEHRVEASEARAYRRTADGQVLFRPGTAPAMAWAYPEDFDIWSDRGWLVAAALLAAAWYGLWRFLSRRLLGREKITCGMNETDDVLAGKPLAVAIHMSDPEIERWLGAEPDAVARVSLFDGPGAAGGEQHVIVRHVGALPDITSDERRKWLGFLAARESCNHAGKVVLQAECDVVTLLSTAFDSERDAFAPEERRQWLAVLARAAEIPRTKPSTARSERLTRSAFRHLWEHSTRAERIALYHLAEERWLNPENRPVIESLVRRGLARPGRPPVIASEILRRYVLSAESPDRFHLWEAEASTGAWKSLRIPFALLLLIILGWLIYIGGDALNFITAALVGAVALITHLANALRLFGGMSGSRM